MRLIVLSLDGSALGRTLCETLGRLAGIEVQRPAWPAGLPPAGADAGDAAPHQVVAALPADATDILLQGAPAPLPYPLSLVGPPPAAEDAARWLAAGLAGWWPSAIAGDAESLRAALAFDAERWQRDRSTRAENRRLATQIDERKWVDRAKGLLMSARGIGEDDAFKLLRNAAMHAHLKLVDVSRSVVDAAHWAEAVNRAGQLRMLSQRLVTLAAERLLRVDPARTRQAQAEATERAQSNLDHLAALALEGEALAALRGVEQAWSALTEVLSRRVEPSVLTAADARAEALLEAADRLTGVLQSQGAREGLGIVNRCGRQRMRAQRLAKQALLTALSRDPAAAARLQATLDEFEAAQREIETSPPASAEVAAALGRVREAWLQVLRALKGTDAAALAHASEALVASLDRLTESCERSLQMLMS